MDTVNVATAIYLCLFITVMVDLMVTQDDNDATVVHLMVHGLLAGGIWMMDLYYPSILLLVMIYTALSVCIVINPKYYQYHYHLLIGLVVSVFSASLTQSLLYTTIST